MTDKLQQKQRYDEHYVLCPHCDWLVEVPLVTNRHKAICPRCSTSLVKYHQTNNQFTALIYASCALVMLLLACSFWLIHIRVMGATNYLDMFMIPKVLIADNYALVAISFILFVLICPLLALLNLILVVSNLPMSRPLRRLLLLVFTRCRHWAMAEIFLAGILVSFVKLISYGDIGVDNSFIPYCLFIVLYLKAMSLFDIRSEWQKVAPTMHVLTPLIAGKTGIGQNIRLCQYCEAIMPFNVARCPRCHQHGKVRDMTGMQWSVAFLLTAIMLYIPANIFAIMTMNFLGSTSSSNIMDGVIYMWQSGDYPIALIIFTASISIPVLKILALSILNYFALHAKPCEAKECQRMHRLYLVVELIGRWSMIDVFVVAVISGLFHHGEFMTVYPEIGVTCFGLVVVMTMIASYRYDPRLIWDRSV